MGYAELEEREEISKVLKMAHGRPTLQRITSMKENVQNSVLEHRNELLHLLSRYVATTKI